MAQHPAALNPALYTDFAACAFFVDNVCGWDDLVFPAVGVNLIGPAVDPTANLTYMTLDFTDAKDCVVHVTYQMPHSWKVGSNVNFHIHWQPSNTDVGSCNWEVRYQWRNATGDVASAAVSAWALVPKAVTPGGVARVAQMDTLASFIGTGKGVSSLLQIELRRLGTTDAFTGDAMLVSLDLHYQIDTVGSVTESSKYGL
jgi:hypothetical protein